MTFHNELPRIIPSSSSILSYRFSGVNSIICSPFWYQIPDQGMAPGSHYYSQSVFSLIIHLTGTPFFNWTYWGDIPERVSPFWFPWKPVFTSRGWGAVCLIDGGVGWYHTRTVNASHCYHDIQEWSQLPLKVQYLMGCLWSNKLLYTRKRANRRDPGRIPIEVCPFDHASCASSHDVYCLQGTASYHKTVKQTDRQRIRMAFFCP